jgi:hypothetical protein
MQFQYNSDYPGVNKQGEVIPIPPVSSPREFPTVHPMPCARITTRIFHPSRNQVATVENVLVRTMLPRASKGDDMDSSMNTSSSSSLSSNSDGESENEPPDRAYWIQRSIRDAIYGRVLFALVLQRRTPSEASNDNAEWEVTNRHAAVKEMSWQHIRRERDRLAEDPVKEVSAMQYLRRFHSLSHGAPEEQQHVSVADSFKAMLDTNIMMPLDLLSDERHLYSIMPYCDGGELFERLDMNERFGEEEARYWMTQVLNVSLQFKQYSVQDNSVRIIT